MKTKNSGLFRYNYFNVIGNTSLLVFILIQISCSNTQKMSIGFTETLEVKSPKIVVTYPKIDSLYIYPLLSLYNFEDSMLSNQLVDFYKQRGYMAAWHDNAEYSSNLRAELINTIKHAEKEGLDSEDYYYLDILRTMHNIDVWHENDLYFPQLKAKLDILLTKAFLKYATHLYTGKIKPTHIDENWEYVYKHKDFSQILELAINSNDLKSAFELLYPKNEQYNKLRNALADLNKLKKLTPWHIAEFNANLRLHDTSQYVFEVRRFLVSTGDYAEEDNQDIENLFIYDNGLELAVKKFQTRHGLKPDGVIGENTRTEMTKNINFRIEQIKANMERLRWLPDTFGEKYIIVNLPEFTLRYYERDSLIEKMKVIIGTNENYTPILKNTIKYIEFNPYWNVPYSIASKDILPKIKRDSTYLKRNRYHLVKGYTKREVIDPTTVDWKEINEENFPFHIRQDPGPKNALGLVKFIFPNSHAIYLHDTPSDYLFNSYERDLSHGCIRLEKPFKLAETMLNNINNLKKDTVKHIIRNGETQKIFLDSPVNVYFTYQTAWVENNELQFRKDVYTIDNKQISLNKILPVQYENRYTPNGLASSTEKQKNNHRLSSIESVNARR